MWTSLLNTGLRLEVQAAEKWILGCPENVKSLQAGRMVPLCKVSAFEKREWLALLNFSIADAVAGTLFLIAQTVTENRFFF